MFFGKKTKKMDKIDISNIVNDMVNIIKESLDKEIQFNIASILSKINKLNDYDSSGYSFICFIDEEIKKLNMSKSNDAIPSFIRALDVIDRNLDIALEHCNITLYEALQEKIKLEIEFNELREKENNIYPLFKEYSLAKDVTKILELKILKDNISNRIEILMNELSRLDESISFIIKNIKDSNKYEDAINLINLYPFRYKNLRKDIDEINFSVITPNRVNPGNTNELYFVLYNSAIDEIVNKLLAGTDYDFNNYKRKLSFFERDYRVVMTSSSNDSKEEIITWKDKYNKCSFILEVPKNYTDDNILVYFDLYQDDIRLLNFECRINVNSNKEPALIKHKVKRVFLSYSKKDLKEVLRIRQGMEALANSQGISLDIIDLKENSDWESVIQNQIDNSDVFYLIWSKNSALKGVDGTKTSVEKEYEYALKLIKYYRELRLIIINIDGIDVPKELIDAEKSQFEKESLKAYISYSKNKEIDTDKIDFILLGMQSLCRANDIEFNIVNYKESINGLNSNGIDSSNIFYLMLNSSSINDASVEDEYKYAIEKHGLDFVYVISLENKESIKIPKSLEKKHLNSTMVYIIEESKEKSLKDLVI